MTKIWVTTLLVAILAFVIGIVAIMFVPIGTGSKLPLEFLVGNALIWLSIILGVVWVIETVYILYKKFVGKKK